MGGPEYIARVWPFIVSEPNKPTFDFYKKNESKTIENRYLNSILTYLDFFIDVSTILLTS